MPEQVLELLRDVSRRSTGQTGGDQPSSFVKLSGMESERSGTSQQHGSRWLDIVLKQLCR
ncbi:MAG TPA: hypothetical protein VEZ11_17555 [Thermoanaerobaculia bacterium]|nr:hypothetical protein [Thermoanaerobaculia bacterium]